MMMEFLKKCRPFTVAWVAVCVVAGAVFQIWL